MYDFLLTCYTIQYLVAKYDPKARGDFSHLRTLLGPMLVCNQPKTVKYKI